MLGVLLASALSTLGCSGAEAAPETQVLSEDLFVERLQDSVWLYRATFEMDIGPVESNGLVVAADSGVWVIDTPWTDELTKRLLDWVEAERGPIQGVVATHFHEDRMGGLAEVHRRGIASYGHAETRRIGLERNLPVPETTFTETLTLGSGSQAIELFYPGGGHSPDNVTAWLPGHRILFGGCALKATAWKGLGFLGDAVVGEWAPSLEALLGRYPNAETVVPGHGGIGGLEIVRHTRDLVLSHLADQAGATDSSARHNGVSWEAVPQRVETADFDSLIDVNVSWIVQTPFGWQSGLEGQVALRTDGRIHWGERDEGLEVTTRLARERGIKTLLKPHIWLSRAGDKWRSDIAMSDEHKWRDWFESYETFILHYARLAERLEIEALCIGTELRQTALQRPDDWRRIIARVREVYGGELTYAANWWREYQEVTFWDDLDYIGIQAYFPLSDRSSPTLADLKSGWQAPFADIREIQKRFDRPVLFTEIGYKAMPGAAIEPWEWLSRQDRSTSTLDLALQADAYRAFFETFWHQPWVAGAYFWKWHPKGGSPKSPDFSPQGKPAERVLAKWYRGA